jgi:hypothetical protein
MASQNAFPSLNACHIPLTNSSIPLPRRLRTRTPTRAPLIPAPLSKPLLGAKLQLALQLVTGILAMNEVAESASHTAFPAIEPAACFAEVRHGRQLAVDGARGVPAGV